MSRRTPRFCDECGVSADLHYDEEDCEGAESKARIIESFDRMVFEATGGRLP